MIVLARGYEDIALPVDDVNVNKKWIIYAMIVISVIVLAIIVVPILPKSLDDRIILLYNQAQLYIDDGNLSQAKLIYSEIIELKPTEEKAWHEKGKILVRTEICVEAVNHYKKYVDIFPESSRGAEGYELAKSCR